MLRSVSTWLLFLFTATLLAACCGSVACECNDGYADAVAVEFDRTSSSAKPFTLEELDTVFLVRTYLRDTAKAPIPDTVVVTRTDSARARPIILNTTSPFTLANNRKIDQYRYKIYLGKRKKPADFLLLDSIDLNGRYQADGCCTCYQSTRRIIYPTGQAPFNATDDTGKNQLVPFIIKRQ
jgi:hypothetical protein